MTRADPTKQRFPNLRGIMMVDTIRGRVRVRAWPKKRGRPKSPAVRDQNRWFREACRNMNYIDAGQMVLAIEAAKGTGLYPRDIIMNAMAGGFLEFEMPDGSLLKYRKPFLEDKVFNGCILHQDTVQTLPGASFTVLTFPLPVIDTAAFWNVAAPTLITIPTNVVVARFTAGWRSNDITLNGQFIHWMTADGVPIIRASQNVGGWPGGTIDSGPRVVSAGQEWLFGIWIASANATKGDQTCFFSCEVLETT